MRNYIIINGINSLTIPGLAINILPPISKPMMRYMREEIDGRDGDINTELGYQAYDRPLEVGLFGDYDINQVIAFFNTQGKITFSDEPDKFYNFQILEKIDFTKLVKFRTATVNIHCQPFKYPLNETPLEVAYEYVEGEGTELTLNDTANAIFNKFDLKGNTSQVQYTGKNLLNYNDYTNQANITIDGDYMTITNSSNATIYPSITFATPLEAGGYTTRVDVQSITSGKVMTLYVMDDVNDYTTSHCIVQAFSSTGVKVLNKTFGDTIKRYMLVVQAGTTIKLSTMLVKGLYTTETIGNFEPYVGGTASPNPQYPQKVNVVSGDNTINIVGKNLLNSEDGTTQTISGVTFTKNSDGTITANGTATAGVTYMINNYTWTTLPAGTYVLSDSVEGENNNTYFTYLDVQNADSLYLSTIATNTRTYSTSFNFRTRIVVRSGVTLNNVVFKPMLEVGSTASTYEPYIGNSYPLYLGVENLFGSTMNITNRGVTITKDSSTIGLNGTGTSTGNINNTSNTFTLEAGTYTMAIAYSSGSLTTNATSYIRLRNSSGDAVITGAEISLTSANYNSGTLTATFTLDQATTMYLSVYVVNTSVYTNLTYNAQIDKGTKVNHTSTTPIELCKIGTYQDYIYKDNGSWYLHKEIGKVVLNGSETIEQQTTSSGNYRFGVSGPNDMKTNSELNVPAGLVISNKFIEISNSESYIGNTNGILVRANNTKQFMINYLEAGAYTTAQFKTWLGNNNILVYYILETPTNTEITDTTLLEQLESLSMANSVQGQTNISQENNDLPFILSVSTLKDGSDHLVINNQGNIYSKPTLDLEGSGIVDIYLNDNQILEADLTEAGEIVIDTEAMEATNPSTGLLANRQVTGDYSRIKLDPGENDLRFSGDLTKATITNYERWL